METDFLCTQALSNELDDTFVNENNFDGDEEKKEIGTLKVLANKKSRIPAIEFLIYSGENVVGRHTGCDISIPWSIALSKKHAVIEADDGTCFVSDCGSSNKTRLGKVRLKPNVKYGLRSGDEITFGDVRCIFCQDDGLSNAPAKASTSGNNIGPSMTPRIEKNILANDTPDHLMTVTAAVHSMLNESTSTIPESQPVSFDTPAPANVGNCASNAVANTSSPLPFQLDETASDIEDALLKDAANNVMPLGEKAVDTADTFCANTTGSCAGIDYHMDSDTDVEENARAVSQETKNIFEADTIELVSGASSQATLVEAAEVKSNASNFDSDEDDYEMSLIAHLDCEQTQRFSVPPPVDSSATPQVAENSLNKGLADASSTDDEAILSVDLGSLAGEKKQEKNDVEEKPGCSGIRNLDPEEIETCAEQDSFGDLCTQELATAGISNGVEVEDTLGMLETQAFTRNSVREEDDTVELESMLFDMPTQAFPECLKEVSDEEQIGNVQKQDLPDIGESASMQLEEAKTTGDNDGGVTLPPEENIPLSATSKHPTPSAEENTGFSEMLPPMDLAGETSAEDTEPFQASPVLCNGHALPSMEKSSNTLLLVRSREATVDVPAILFSLNENLQAMTHGGPAESQFLEGPGPPRVDNSLADDDATQVYSVEMELVEDSVKTEEYVSVSPDEHCLGPRRMGVLDLQENSRTVQNDNIVENEGTAVVKNVDQEVGETPAKESSVNKESTEACFQPETCLGESGESKTTGCQPKAMATKLNNTGGLGTGETTLEKDENRVAEVQATNKLNFPSANCSENFPTSSTEVKGIRTVGKLNLLISDDSKNLDDSIPCDDGADPISENRSTAQDDMQLTQDYAKTAPLDTINKEKDEMLGIAQAYLVEGPVKEEHQPPPEHEDERCDGPMLQTQTYVMIHQRKLKEQKTFPDATNSWQIPLPSSCIAQASSAHLQKETQPYTLKKVESFSPCANVESLQHEQEALAHALKSPNKADSSSPEDVQSELEKSRTEGLETSTRLLRKRKVNPPKSDDGNTAAHNFQEDFDALHVRALRRTARKDYATIAKGTYASKNAGERNVAKGGKNLKGTPQNSGKEDANTSQNKTVVRKSKRSCTISQSIAVVEQNSKLKEFGVRRSKRHSIVEECGTVGIENTSEKNSSSYIQDKKQLGTKRSGGRKLSQSSRVEDAANIPNTRSSKDHNDLNRITRTSTRRNAAKEEDDEMTAKLKDREKVSEDVGAASSSSAACRSEATENLQDSSSRDGNCCLKDVKLNLIVNKPETMKEISRLTTSCHATCAEQEPARSVSHDTSASSGERRTTTKRKNAAASSSSSLSKEMPTLTKKMKEHEIDANSELSLRRALRPKREKPRVMFTGILDGVAEGIVTNLGGKLASDIADCTHLVTDEIRRTIKFLCALARGLHIVTPQWLHSSAQQCRFMPEEDFQLSGELRSRNAESLEEKYDFQFEQTLQLAKENPAGLFRGFSFFVTKNVAPTPQQMHQILRSAGARVLTRMPAAVSSPDVNTVVIATPNDRRACASAIKAGCKIVTNEFVLTGILRYRVEWAPYALFESCGGER